MRAFVIASNRVPALDGDASAGGLAVALKAVLRRHGGLWLGWSGRTAEQPSPRVAITEADGFALGTLDLTAQERSRYYNGMANRVLWPVFHGRLDLARLDHGDYGAYRAVNRRFADALLTEVGPGTIVWVHDYHLIPLGRLLRNRRVQAPIGFFLHVPFPSPETFAALPWAVELIGDLAAYDLVGFQTDACLRNFLDFVERHGLGRRVGGNRVRIGSATLSVGAFPVGADTRRFATLAASPAVTARVARLRESLGTRLAIAGVDRLDYSKGLHERFEAIETLLDRHPEWIGRTTLFQVAAPSRLLVPEYRAIQSDLESMSGRLNAKYGTVDWTPIRLLNRTVVHGHVAALLRASRVGLVTPLRDGMNLVAKEFVAAQDPADPGVLVLSRFAGAAEELPAALLVNPHDVEATAEAVRTALEMPLGERIARWRPMFRHLAVHDVHRWHQRFIDALRRARNLGTAARSTALPPPRHRKFAAGMRWLNADRPMLHGMAAPPGRARGKATRRRPADAEFAV